MLAFSRKVDLLKYPPLSSTAGPSWQSSTVTGPSFPSVTPAEITVFSPAMRQPGYRVTPRLEMWSSSTSGPISTASGFGIATPLLHSSAARSADRDLGSIVSSCACLRAGLAGLPQGPWPSPAGAVYSTSVLRAWPTILFGLPAATYTFVSTLSFGGRA